LGYLRVNEREKRWKLLRWLGKKMVEIGGKFGWQLKLGVLEIGRKLMGISGI
jgi:hypothetical protein